jgi:pimeloyl-ACP methyl ester carboxylesterase
VRSSLLAKPAAVIRYMDFDGDQLPLVFIHGLGCAGSSHFPRLLGEPAIAGHRSIVIDLFGHGYSDRPADFGYTLEEHADTVAQLADNLSRRLRRIRPQHGRRDRSHPRRSTT